MNNNIVIGTVNAQEIFDDLNKRIWDIPFDNSQFQNENFIINAAITPERAYRSAALRLQDRLEALKSAHFERRKSDIKIKMLQRDIDNCDDDLKKELLQIEIEEIQSGRIYSDKLINDAIVEATQLYNFVYSCPEYTREDFEKAEKDHFEKRLLLDVNGISGAAKSLVDMGLDINALKDQRIVYSQTLADAQRKNLLTQGEKK